MSEAAMQETKALRVAVVVYLVIFVLKLVVFMLSGVMALLAEALHTLSDIFVSVFLLIAVVWSRRPPDERHPYGHGRARYVGAQGPGVVRSHAVAAARPGIRVAFSHPRWPHRRAFRPSLRERPRKSAKIMSSGRQLEPRG